MESKFWFVFFTIILGVSIVTSFYTAYHQQYALLMFNFGVAISSSFMLGMFYMDDYDGGEE